MLDSDHHTDVVLRHKDSGKTWKLHKVILGSEFKFFDNAFKDDRVKFGLSTGLI
jgi:hypothetical protein